MKKTFLICPVRGHLIGETQIYVDRLEKEGYEVHWPPRDTPQNDPTGFNICRVNRQAILDSDIVHIIWDGKSQGCLFDMGMAFMEEKNICPISIPRGKSGEKNFSNMIFEWAKLQGE